MDASQARFIATEPIYFREIRAAAQQGRTSTVLSFTDRPTANSVKEILLSNGYIVGKVKVHSDMLGDDFQFTVEW